MRRTVPLMIAATCGTILIITAFIPATVSWGETAAVWFDVLAAIAFLLGGGNLLKTHLRRISDQTEGWAYSLITVVTFLATLIVGLFKLGITPGVDQEYYGESFAKLRVNQLPEELTAEVRVDLPDALLDKEYPSSVRRQFSISRDEAGMDLLQFRGWMRPGQKKELFALHQNLTWQCAIEQLAEKATAPEPLQGQIRYLADHRSLVAQGMLTESQEEALRNVSTEAAWQQAIEVVVEKSREVTEFEVDSVPSQFEIPEAYDDRLSYTEGTFEVIGPISPEMKEDLADIFPRTRPLSNEQARQFVEELASLEGGLTDDEKNLALGLLQSGWTVEMLIGTLNTAGEREPLTKSACALLAEKGAGETNLLLEVPPDEPDVELNEEQVEYLEASISDPDFELSAFGAGLAERGEFTDKQRAALEDFLDKAQTIPLRNRMLAAALSEGDETLSDEQYEFLLSDYRVQHEWREAMHEFMVAAHRVKYPWSGEYIDVGSPFWWSYEYAFKPLTATMFSLLAFYVASAAFRAFRAKNFEAFLLLGTAFIILLGRTFAGPLLTGWLPDSLAFLKIENITVFIMSVINTAGNRAIMIGISLGIVSTSLKILLGVDRSYLGSGDD